MLFFYWERVWSKNLTMKRNKILFNIFAVLTFATSSLVVRAQISAPAVGARVAINGGQAIAGQVLVRLRPEFDNAATLVGLSAIGTATPRSESRRFYRLNLRPNVSARPR